jgi:hypothetical protein
MMSLLELTSRLESTFASFPESRLHRFIRLTLRTFFRNPSTSGYYEKLWAIALSDVKREAPLRRLFSIADAEPLRRRRP